MNLASGVDAFDDLLADVAAFGEVEGVGLGGLLGEIAVADVLAEFGDGGEDAVGFDGFGGGFKCAGIWRQGG